jgi:hypothetical protein
MVNIWAACRDEKQRVNLLDLLCRERCWADEAPRFAPAVTIICWHDGRSLG